MAMWRALALGILGALAATPALANRDTAQFTSITVFGDSLVDAGNLYKSNGGTRPDPALGYFDHHFTNGYDYPDLLSIDLFGEPTTPSLLGGNNYAYGGARIIDTGDVIPDLQAQLDAFAKSGNAVDPNGLYILNFGANDVFGAKGVFGQQGALGSYADTTSYFLAAAAQYVAAVQTLNDMGVRNILMTDFPLAGDPFTIEANADLKAALANLTLSSDTDFFFYSLSDFNLRVLQNPAAFGLPAQDISTNCIAANAQATGCTGIFSFDGIHPTAAIQAAGYQDMNQRFGLTASVPEPASWAMMLIGFGVVGAAMRYRRRSVTVSFA